VPRADRATNPVDLGISATPDDLRAAVAAVLADEDVDAAIVLSVDLAGVSPAEMLAALEPDEDGRVKPVVASIVQADGRMAAAPGSVPNFRFPEACAEVLSLAADRRAWLSRPLGQRPPFADIDVEATRALARSALGETIGGGVWLGHDTITGLLGGYGIELLPARRCADPDEAVAAAAAIDGPVVLKAELPGGQQAGEIDAALVGLEGEQALRAGWEALRDRVASVGRTWLGATVQALAPAGVDVLVGSINHRDLGVVTGVGAGGRQAGLAGDVTFRLAPSTDVDADELVRDSPVVAAWLAGERPGGALDRDALEALVLRLSRLFEHVPELLEGDLNPIRLHPGGATVLDARLKAGLRAERERIRTW
jgi:acyl-CoA synthetase (NDP forming)